MKKHLLFFIFVFTVNIVSYTQTVDEIQEWAKQQTGKLNSEDVATFINVNRSGEEITFTDGFVYSTMYPGPQAITTLDESRFVVAYRLGSQDADGLAIIGTINDSIITFSPEYTFNYGATYSISICSLDSNSIVIAYTDSPNYGYGTAVVGKITGDTISFSNEYVYNPSNTENNSVISLDSEHFIVAYLNPSSSYLDSAYVNLGTVSGNSIAFGDKVMFDEEGFNHISATSLDSSNFVITYSYGGIGKAIVGTVAGNIITFGSKYNFCLSDPNWVSVTTLNDSCFVLAYSVSIICAKAIVGMVDGNIITFGDETLFEPDRIVYLCAITMDENHVVISYNDRGAFPSVIGKTILGTVSELNISFGDEYTFSIYSNTQDCPSTALDPYHLVVAFCDVLNTGLGTATLGTISGYPVQTSISSNTACPGSFNLPINVKYIENVTEFSLNLWYDTTNLSYVSYQNLNTQFNSDSLNITEDLGEINISYSSNIPANILADILIELDFTVDTVQYQSMEDLIWYDSLGFYINSSGDSLETIFENGIITIMPLVGDVGPIIGSDSVCQGASGETYAVVSIINATSYQWSIVPDVADSIVIIDTTAIVYFQPDYFGPAMLSMYGSNYCGNSDSSYLNINIIGFPTLTAGSDTTICEDVSYTLNGSANNYNQVYWSTTGDGSFDDPFLLNAIYTPGFDDISNGSVYLILTASPLFPCVDEASDSLLLFIQNILSYPQTPQGPTVIMLDTNLSSEYFIYSVSNTASYQWYLEPDDAGSIVGEDTTAIVYWNESFTGLMAYIRVVALNACGEASSDSLIVNLSPVGEYNNSSIEPEITISPNPSSGIFNISIKGADKDMELSVINSRGEIIQQKKVYVTRNGNTYRLDLSSESSGLYYLKFTDGRSIILKKVLINH